MKLPSVTHIADQSLKTFSRFPFAILSAIIGTAAVLVLAQEEFAENHPLPWLFNTAVVGFLGISLMTFAQFWAERFALSFRQWLALHLAVVAVLVMYWFVLPENVFEAPLHNLFRFWLIVLGTHLFVAVGPFIGRGSVDAFWEFNKSLLLRMVTAGLYSGVLYVGLAVALAAVDNLFNAEIRPIRYLQLWWFLAGVFNTWFFLSGVPNVSGLADKGVSYPKGLKVFSQYVLVPLVTVYLAILYAYMAKIVIEWDWPQGWVGYLVLGFSTSGILTILLVHPIKDALDNRWMAALTRWFYVAILPPSVLLLLAIWRRVSEYGLTENRYFVVVLGFWLIGISLYFLLSTRKNIKVIPLSLGIIALASSVGPWSAMSVSQWNQMGRLEQVLGQNNMLAEGHIVRTASPVSYADARRISSVIRYIVEVHGTEELQPWFGASLDSIAASSQARWQRADDVARRIVSSVGIEYVPEFQVRAGRSAELYTFTSDVTSFDIGGYGFVHTGEMLNDTRRESAFTGGGRKWVVAMQPDSSVVSVQRLDDRGVAADAVVLQIGPVIESLMPARTVQFRSVSVGGDSLVVAGQSGSLAAKALLRRLVVERDSSGVKISQVTLDLFLKSD